MRFAAAFIALALVAPIACESGGAPGTPPPDAPLITERQYAQLNKSIWEVRDEKLRMELSQLLEEAHGYDLAREGMKAEAIIARVNATILNYTSYETQQKEPLTPLDTGVAFALIIAILLALFPLALGKTGARKV